MHRYYTKHAMDLLEEPLEEANLKDIVNDLEKVAKDWMKIGLQLSLKPDKLEKIDSEQKESSDKLLKMLVQWLRVEKHPTRMAIVKALESNSVGVTRLAHKLREEYTSNKRQKLNTQDMDVPCTNKCGWKGPQTALQEHLTAECPKQLVACEYKDDLGCCRELVPRDQLEKYMHTNMQKHLDLAMNCVSKESMLSKLQVKQVEDTVKQQLEKCLSQELVSSLQKSMKQVEKQVYIKLKEADNKLTELKNKLETKQSEPRSDINSAVTKEITGIFIAPCTFYISAFHEEWKSPPFYSHLGGSKMHIKLWPTKPNEKYTTFTVFCDYNSTYFMFNSGGLSVTVEAMKFDPTNEKVLVPIIDYKDTVEVPASGTDGSKGELPNLMDYGKICAECHGIRISVAGVDELVINTRN